MRTVCVVANCPELAARNGRCAAHQLPRLHGRVWQRLVVRVVARDAGICWLCGRAGATSADHVVRLVDGGSNAMSNLRAAHLSCNQRRG